MNDSILSANLHKRRDYSMRHLFCFAMFCFWQMGFIYFMGPALTIGGWTPLPIKVGNLIALIVLSHVLSILYMIFLPRYVVWAERVGTVTAIVTVLGMFLPLSEGMLRGLIYAHVFVCYAMTGFEIFIVVNYLSEKSAIYVQTAGYGLALLLIALFQNDLFSVTFSGFRGGTLVGLVLLLIFVLRLPATPDACPQFVRKDSGLVAPKRLLTGTYVLVFISALMTLFGPAVSTEVEHGVFVTYFVDAAVSMLIFFLYRKTAFHPFRCVSFCVSLGCVGFLLMYAANYIPALQLVSCGLIGVGMVSCQMIPVYAMMLMTSYPSRYLSPAIIALELLAMLVQSNMVEAFRSIPSLLCLAYAVVMVVLVILYLQIAPYFLYTLHRKIQEDTLPENISAEDSPPEASPEPVEQEPAVQAEGECISPPEADPGISPFALLSRRELEVVDLIARGYRNAEIASMLVISVHTVNDHTKKIYRKLNVHSRLEVAALANHQREPVAEL